MAWTALVAAVGLTVANVADWVSFRSALGVAQRVSATDWAVMFAKARELAEGKGRRLTGPELPPEFAALRATEADFFGYDAQFRLWARGELGVFVNFRFGPGWEKISHHVSRMPHRSSTVWSADPALTELLEPSRRLLTVMAGGYGQPLREWIVLPSEIRIVEHNFRERSQIALSFPLSHQSRDKITAMADAIPTEFRGRLHTSGGVDGIFLRVAFRADGQPGWEDIELANIWCEELGALVDALSAALPVGQAVDFKARVARDSLDFPTKRSSRTWAKIAAEERAFLKLPWWCVWPRWTGLPLSG